MNLVLVVKPGKNRIGAYRYDDFKPDAPCRFFGEGAVAGEFVERTEREFGYDGMLDCIVVKHPTLGLLIFQEDALELNTAPLMRAYRAECEKLADVLAFYGQNDGAEGESAEFTAGRAAGILDALVLLGGYEIAALESAQQLYEAQVKYLELEKEQAKARSVLEERREPD